MKQYRLSAIRLVGFHNYGDVLIPVRGDLFVVGANESGKTTILDAVHLVLSGEQDLEWNAAASPTGRRKSGRTLQGIILRANMAGQATRLGGSISYAVVQLDSIDSSAQPTSLIFGASVTDMHTQIQKWAAVAPVRAEDLPLTESLDDGTRRILDRDEFEARLGHRLHKGPRGLGDYRISLANKLFNNREHFDEVTRLWRTGKSYHEIATTARDDAEGQRRDELTELIAGLKVQLDGTDAAAIKKQIDRLGDEKTELESKLVDSRVHLDTTQKAVETLDEQMSKCDSDVVDAQHRLELARAALRAVLAPELAEELDQYVFGTKRGSHLKEEHLEDNITHAREREIELRTKLVGSDGVLNDKLAIRYAFRLEDDDALLIVRDRANLELDSILEERRDQERQMKEALLQAIRSIRELSLLDAPPAPLPTELRHRCFGCSLATICQPEETLYCLERRNLTPVEEAAAGITRVLPQGSEGAVLYLQEQGAYVSKRSEHLIVKKHGEEIQRVPIVGVQQVVIFGNVQITTQALGTLATLGVPLIYLTMYGRFVAATMPTIAKNALLRVNQFKLFADPQRALTLAKAVVKAKISNQRTLLMRSLRSRSSEESANGNENGRGSDEPAARDMAELLSRVDRISDPAVLLGTEGQAAALYFSQFNRMLKGAAPRNAMDTYLVAYDICHPKRLRKVARTCEDFGFRRQYSVFLCRLSTTDLVRLKSRLYDIINLQEDQVLFIPLCGKCADQIEALGRPVEKHDSKDVVIVT